MNKPIPQRRAFLAFFLLFSALFLAHLPRAQAADTQLEWYGQSAFKITTPSGKVLLLDPWITNPKNPDGTADVAALTHVDLILITHGHFDHVGNAAQIARQTGAKLVCTGDLAAALVDYGGFPKAQSSMENEGNFGGEVTLLDGEVKVAFVPAVHSSAVVSEGGMDQHFAGNPSGLLITIKNGPTIYDTGDTDVFSDMTLIPQIHKVDVMLCCIGDHYTMGPYRAAIAVGLIKPSRVIPMHYGTFPLLTGTPEAFDSALKQRGIKVKMDVMQIHQTLPL